jgi:hypothetical protein
MALVRWPVSSVREGHEQSYFVVLRVGRVLEKRKYLVVVIYTIQYIESVRRWEVSSCHTPPADPD